MREMKLIYNYVIKRYAFGLYKPIKVKSITENSREIKKNVKSSFLKQVSPSNMETISSETDVDEEIELEDSNPRQIVPEESERKEEWHSDYKVRCFVNDRYY